MKFLRAIFALFRRSSSETTYTETDYKILWNRWVAEIAVTTDSGRVCIRFYKCMLVGAARPQVIVVVDGSDASEAMSKKVAFALKRELNHFAKLLMEITFTELKVGEVALLTNLHSASEACAFVDRVKAETLFER